MDPSVQKLLAAIDDRLAKLEELMKEGPASIIPERLHRWKEATATLLLERVSEDAAQRFTRIKPVMRVMPRFGQRSTPGFLIEAAESRDFLQGLKKDISSDPAAVIQTARSNSHSAAAVTMSREGLFVAGQVFDAWRHLDGVLSTARASIVIVDGYVGPEVLALLTGKPKAVAVEILTNQASAKFLAAAKAFNAQYGRLSVRESAAFHDRFIVVDRIDFYHFGASLKDLGKRGFMFSRLEEPVVVSSLQQAIDSEWKKAKPCSI